MADIRAKGAATAAKYRRLEEEKAKTDPEAAARLAEKKEHQRQRSYDLYQDLKARAETDPEAAAKLAQKLERQKASRLAHNRK